MKILIAAGGSGGHLLPAQQLASELIHDNVLFAGHLLDRSSFFDRKKFHFEAIPSAPLRFSFLGIFAFIRATICGLIHSIQLIRRFQPDVVVGFGSYHVFPVLCATVLLKRKLVLFEANCLLGKVNRLFASQAKIVASQFLLNHRRTNAQLVPLLPWILPTQKVEKNEARTLLGLKSDRETFLVFGGSQGAEFLNQTIPFVLPSNAQVIHLAGNENAANEVRQRYQLAGIFAIVKAFESNMPLVYSAADYAICRSGAGTIAELIKHCLPAILLPFPLASDDHQRINAQFLAKKVGGATMLIEKMANSKSLAEEIVHLQEKKAQMHLALKQFQTECAGRMSFSEQIIHIGKNL